MLDASKLLLALALLSLASSCSKSSEATPVSQSVAEVASSSAPSSATSPSSVPSVSAQASAAQLAKPKVDALEVCMLIEAAKVGTACQRMPPTHAGEDVAQFEMKGTPTRPETLYGAVFACASRKQCEERLAELSSANAKQGTNGNKRLPGVVVGNEKVLAFAYADGELLPEHAVEIRRIILALKP